MSYRVIVCGSRDWTDRATVDVELHMATRRSRESAVIVHGACPTGADKIANDFATRHGLTVERHPADWNKHGKAAGPIRNCEMASAGAELCLAFWDGRSKGTRHMIEAAVQCGIPVRIVPAKVEARKGAKADG